MSAPDPQPFGASDYQIEYVPLEQPREVNIGAHAATPLQVGDSYTIARSNCVYDLIVEEISRTVGGRWNARCRVSQPFCL
jgi:hypothetical protein